MGTHTADEALAVRGSRRHDLDPALCFMITGLGPPLRAGGTRAADQCVPFHVS